MGPVPLSISISDLGEASLKKNEKIWDNVPIGGGRVKKKQKCPNFNLGHLKTEGGVTIFQKCLN